MRKIVFGFIAISSAMIATSAMAEPTYPTAPAAQSMFKKPTLAGIAGGTVGHVFMVALVGATDTADATARDICVPIAGAGAVLGSGAACGVTAANR